MDLEATVEFKGLLVRDLNDQMELEPDGSVFIKGFASMKALDRQGDIVDPKLFNIERFLKNGQLLYDHKKWKTKAGNEINIGKVTELHVARVEKIAGSKGKFRVLDMKGNVLESEIAGDVDFDLKRGDRGLWVKAHVMEEEVAKQIVDGRLNTFSWSGTVFSKSDGTPVEIDLHEISVVMMPANAKALFMVGKNLSDLEEDGTLVGLSRYSNEPPRILANDALLKDDLASMTHYAVAFQKDERDPFTMFLPERVKTAQEAVAIARGLSNVLVAAAVALQPTGKVTGGGTPVYEVLNVQTFEKEVSNKMTPLEKELLKTLATKEDEDVQALVEKLTGDDTGSPIQEKGGEEHVDKATKETLDTLSKGVTAILDAQTTQNDSIESLAKRLTDLESKSEADVKAKADDEDKKVEPKADVKKADDADDADDTGDDALAKALVTLAEGIDSVQKAQTEQNDAIEKLSDRLEKVEDKPVSAKTITDDEKPTAERDLAAEVKKHMSTLDAKQVSRLRRNALKETVLPAALVGRR